MATIGEALIKFTSDATGTLSSLQSVAKAADDTNTKSSGALASFQAQMGKSVDASQAFAKAFLEVSAAVGAAAIGFSVKAVEAYNEHNQVLTQMQAALKSTGDASGLFASDLTDQAEAIQNLTGISRDAVLSGSNMLQTFTNIKGPQFQQATQAVVDMATALNGGAIPNMEQTREQALQLGKALNDPATGMSMLRREGVTFTDEQKEQVKAMEAAGNTAGAQNLMLAELQKEFGGSAVAAGTTFAGQVDKAKNTLNDFMVSVGALITQVGGKLLASFNDWVDSMGGVDGIMQKVTSDVQNFIAWGEKHKTLLIAIAGAIAGPLVVAFVTWAYSATAAAIATALALLPVMLLGAGIAALAYVIYTNWNSIKSWTEGLWHNVSGFFQNMVKDLQGAWSGVPQFFKGLATTIGDALLLPFLPFIMVINAVIDGMDKLAHANIPKLPVPSMPHFATGGIVGGNGFASQGPDTVPAMLSPGEMVLNASQQAQLFQMANGGQGGTGGGNNFNFKVGLFAGTPGELRTIAEKLQIEITRLQNAGRSV